jgi:hypothetical protein
MKKPDEWTELFCQYATFSGFVKAIQKEAYNQAIDDAANSVTTKEKNVCSFSDFCGTTEIKETIINKKSILKLKMK